MNKNDIDLDNLIKQRIQSTSQLTARSRFELEPSVDFLTRTMSRIHGIEQRRQTIGYFMVILISFLPLITRQAWMFFRGNHFHVSYWPLGPQIAFLYGFFISNTGLYSLLFLAIIFSLIRFFRIRREPGASIKIA